MGDESQKVFKPELESVEEFLERWKVQNFGALQKLKPEENEQKVMLLACALPVEVLTDIQRKLKPTLLSAAKYPDVEEHLKSLFSKKKSYIGAAVSFFTRKQQNGESIETFSKVLNELFSQSNYQECCRDKLLRDVFISGLISTKIMTSLIHDSEGKKFDEVVKRAKLIEQVQHDVEDIKPASRTFSQNFVKQNNRNDSNEKKNNYVSPKFICWRCLAQGKHHSSTCFARKLTCNVCQTIGHLGKACKGVKKSNNNKKYNPSVKNVEEDDDYSQYFVMKYVGVSNESDPKSNASTSATTASGSQSACERTAPRDCNQPATVGQMASESATGPARHTPASTPPSIPTQGAVTPTSCIGVTSDVLDLKNRYESLSDYDSDEYFSDCTSNSDSLDDKILLSNPLERNPSKKNSSFLG